MKKRINLLISLWQTANEGLKLDPHFGPLLANRARAMMASGHSQAPFQLQSEVLP